MAFANIPKAALAAAFSRSASDTGSPEVQIALLCQRVEQLTAHLAASPKDLAAARQIKRLAQRRASLARYVAKRDMPQAVALAATLGFKLPD